MSIKQDETSFTTDEYNSLKNSVVGATYSLGLYQWQPQWEIFDGDPLYYPDFDAIGYDGGIISVNRFAAKNQSGNISGYSSVSSPKNGTALSLATDSGNVYVFAITTTGISLRSWNSSTWSSWSSILTDSNVVFIAATTKDTLHYITKDTTNYHFQFHVLINDSGWTTIDSDIYWGYEINSFAAKQLNGVDILTIASDLPGIQSVKVIGTAIQKNLLPSGGIQTFTYKYGTWSDHREIDHIDQWSSFRYRSRVRMSLIGDTLWLTAYSSEGTQTTPITGYRIYSSKDGIHWSRGELFPFPVISEEGVVILLYQNILYAATYSEIYSAKSTLWFGNPHSDTMLNVPQYVLDMQIDRQDIQQLSFTIDNRRGWLNSSFFAGSRTLAAIVYTGYLDVKIQQGIFEVDTFDRVNDLPQNYIQFTARDHFAWLADKSQSEQFWNWSPQIIGVDEYIDSTGTGYGGMTYSAPAIGSFRAFDGALQLASSNEEGIVLNTWLTDNWNGSVESRVSLATTGHSEYIGLIFRMPDKDNGFIYKYNQSDDKLKLIFRLEGSDSNVLWSSSTMGWSGDTDPHYLKVVYRYSRILMYSAAIGSSLEWELEHSMLVAGQVSTSDPLLQSGYVGSIGYGFSDLPVSAPMFGSFPEGDLPTDYSRYIEPTPETPIEPTYSHRGDFTCSDWDFYTPPGHYAALYTPFIGFQNDPINRTFTTNGAELRFDFTGSVNVTKVTVHYNLVYTGNFQAGFSCDDSFFEPNFSVPAPGDYVKTINWTGSPHTMATLILVFGNLYAGTPKSSDWTITIQAIDVETIENVDVWGECP